MEKVKPKPGQCISRPCFFWKAGPFFGAGDLWWPIFTFTMKLLGDSSPSGPLCEWFCLIFSSVRWGGQGVYFSFKWRLGFFLCILPVWCTLLILYPSPPTFCSFASSTHDQMHPLHVPFSSISRRGNTIYSLLGNGTWKPQRQIKTFQTVPGFVLLMNRLFWLMEYCKGFFHIINIGVVINNKMIYSPLI